MWKKAFSFVILALVLVHLAGFYMYFVVRLGEIRMSMRMKLADLPAEQLQAIPIPVQDFQSRWLDDHEMEWRSNMYDIARVKPSGDMIVVFCLRDNDEDGLLNFMVTIVDMTRQDSRPAPTQVVQFFSLKYVASPPLAVVPVASRLVAPYSYSSVFPNSLSVVPSSPPPRA